MQISEYCSLPNTAKFRNSYAQKQAQIILGYEFCLITTWRDFSLLRPLALRSIRRFVNFSAAVHLARILYVILSYDFPY
jgi:hypothetical protein